MTCDDEKNRQDDQPFMDREFQIEFERDGELHTITLVGDRSLYDFEYEDGELEIEAKEGDFELEMEGIDHFEFVTPVSTEDNPNEDSETANPASTIDLFGPLHDFDFLTQEDGLVARHRFNGEEVSLAGSDSFIAGAETFRTADILSQVRKPGPDLLAEGGPRLMTVNTPDATPSVVWDQILQSIIVETGGGPTNAARAFSMMHTAIYDAHASFDPFAQRVAIDLQADNLDLSGRSDISGAQVEEAMHIAAHTVLLRLYPEHQMKFDQVLSERLGQDMHDDGLVFTVAIDAAEDVLGPRLVEEAQLQEMSGGIYAPVNTTNLSEGRIDIARWTPEKQGKLSPTPEALQTFLTPELSLAEGFALPETPTGQTDTLLTRPDGPEPFFVSDQVDAVLDFQARTVTLSSPTNIDGVFFEAGSTVPVSKGLIGPVINPAFIAQSEAIVQTSAALTEDQKLIAEFWEDGPGTSFPPGAWMTIAQYVSQRDGHDAATDAQLFMTMGNAMFDAAIATWDAKVHFDYARPVTVIRDLGYLGLIGEMGIDELTKETGHVVQAFGGVDPDTGTSLGTRTILAENFLTYQLPGGELSPPFAEYTSGHSTFSAAGAAVLRAFTGSDNFGAHIAVPPKTSAFDAALPGDVYNFQWDTFTDAAVDGGASRIYGGIHFSDGNLDGLSMGDVIGRNAFEVATDFASGNALPEQQPFFEEFYLG